MVSISKWIVLGTGTAAIVYFGATAADRLWPRELTFDPRPHPPVWVWEEDREKVKPDGEFVCAEVGRFDDELLAYLNFDYLRWRPYAQVHDVMLTTKEVNGQPVYRVWFAHKDNDIVSAVTSLSELVADGYIEAFDLKWYPPSVLAARQAQTRMFMAAYQLPVERRLESMAPSQLTHLTERFILFKSVTDPRVRRQVEPIPEVLSREEARQFAADIITVAEFFSLPLEFFLGIGAMENNYMDVQGDLNHAVWKPRAQKGDIILRRRGGRVLVLNYATGPWQITRETLRYSHRLYLRDDRDYSLLPERLRPPRTLNLDEISTGVLTTYAGLLFRHLLDLFDGDVVRAVGAYNGGIRNPNLRYQEGVRLVAEYARRIMEQSAVLKDQSVGEIQFFAPPRQPFRPAAAAENN